METMQPDNLTNSQKEQLMEMVKQEIAVANVQELIEKITDKCFKKCISKPGVSLDNSEQKCLAMCMDRYMETYNVVYKSYSQRLLKERNRM